MNLSDKSGNHRFCTTEEERRTRFEKQRNENPFHRFVEGHLVWKSGLVDKRKVSFCGYLIVQINLFNFQGLFARRRMLLLTEGPHLYYVDPTHMELKGQIPWSKQLRPEAKNFRVFFVHTVSSCFLLLCFLIVFVSDPPNLLFGRSKWSSSRVV